ncbi:hypothetical protein EAF04_004166 [Stromatinia cepivora]|nr:hypothetical protein EAF04_004166 [Stromatinia cepivora]
MHFIKITTSLVSIAASATALAMPQAGPSDAAEEIIEDWNTAINQTISYVDTTVQAIQTNKFGNIANFPSLTNDTLNIVKIQSGLNDQLDDFGTIMNLNALHDVIQSAIAEMITTLNTTLGLSPTENTFTSNVGGQMQILSANICDLYLLNVVRMWQMVGETNLSGNLVGLQSCVTFDPDTGDFVNPS